MTDKEKRYKEVMETLDYLDEITKREGPYVKFRLIVPDRDDKLHGSVMRPMTLFEDDFKYFILNKKLQVHNSCFEIPTETGDERIDILNELLSLNKSCEEHLRSAKEFKIRQKRYQDNLYFEKMLNHDL